MIVNIGSKVNERYLDMSIYNQNGDKNSDIDGDSEYWTEEEDWLAMNENLRYVGEVNRYDALGNNIYQELSLYMISGVIQNCEVLEERETERLERQGLIVFKKRTIIDPSFPTSLLEIFDQHSKLRASILLREVTAEELED